MRRSPGVSLELTCSWLTPLSLLHTTPNAPRYTFQAHTISIQVTQGPSIEKYYMHLVVLVKTRLLPKSFSHQTLN